MRNCPVRRSMRIPATIDARRDITDGAEAHPRCWLSASAAQPPSHPQPWPASASTWAEPFDFDGAYLHLTGAFCNPKPVQRPHPPILIGGRSTATLRVVAEHADLWNIPGGDIDDAGLPSVDGLWRVAAELSTALGQRIRSDVFRPASASAWSRFSLSADLGPGPPW